MQKKPHQCDFRGIETLAVRQMLAMAASSSMLLMSVTIWSGWNRQVRGARCAYDYSRSLL